MWHIGAVARITRAIIETAALLALLGSACHGDAPAPPSAGANHEPRGPTSEADRADDPHADPDPQASASKRAPYTPPSTLGAPVETRVADRTRTVYAEPDPNSALRGRILGGDRFHLYDRREGPGCKQQWAQVAEAGWTCLERTSPTTEAPRALPTVATGELLPFIYARHKGHKDRSTPPLPVYANASAFKRGDPPIETLPAYGSYAFIRSVGKGSTKGFLTASRRVVSAAKLDVFKPSEFAGQELLDAAIPPGTTLAWAVRWKTLIRASADPSAEVVGRVGYHDALYVRGDGQKGSDGERWFEVPELGWISDHDIRRFLPKPPAAPLAGQITVDIDLEQQVLSVWREDQAQFATLISSGKPGDATPLGLYRIQTKWAYGKMASLATADDPYYVDAVPWAMYFSGRYALHAAYWHDLFGHRLSHGCVNLSPRDAKRVFDLITPALPPGWLLVHEHARDPGAVVRVRNGDRDLAQLTDHRKPLRP